MTGEPVEGLGLALLAGAMSGNCMLPFKFARRWRFEHISLVSSIVSARIAMGTCNGAGAWAAGDLPLPAAPCVCRSVAARRRVGRGVDPVRHLSSAARVWSWIRDHRWPRPGAGHCCSFVHGAAQFARNNGALGDSGRRQQHSARGRADCMGRQAAGPRPADVDRFRFAWAKLLRRCFRSS